ncbi:benzoate 4-monooxygenase cytochrome P450, partial [Bimuria novae-zelandiae CBS 107.79]
LGYLIVATIHNLFFHPLSSAPGPFLARISSLPSFYHACKGDRHLWIWQNFQIYGDKFRAAPNTILFNSPRAYTDIHGTRAYIVRGSFYSAWKRNERDLQLFNITDPSLHATRRKLLNLAFTDQALKAATPVVAKHIDRWIGLLGENEGDSEGWSPPVNMAVAVSQLVFDILGELCFGESFNIKEPGDNELKEVPERILKQIAFGYKLSKSPIFGAILYLQPRGLLKVLEKIRSKQVKVYNTFMENSVDRRIAAHRANPSPEAKDMFHFLLKAIYPDDNLPEYPDRNYFLCEARLNMITGFDTTTTTLSGLFFYLSHYPTVLAKLVMEIRSAFNTSEEIVPGVKLNQCKYLRACIDEGLRLAHPVPGEMPRQVRPGGAVIEAVHYPAGTKVGCAAWAFGRNESVYGDASVFRPERWMPSDEEEFVRLRRAFHPSSIGPLNCVGQGLAMLELQLVMAKTVWAMDFGPAPGVKMENEPELEYPPVYHFKDTHIVTKDGRSLRFRPRFK